jgi:FkbM family methyltransferase
MSDSHRKSLIGQMADSRAVQRIVVGLKLPLLVNFALERFPLQRRVEGTEACYRVRRVETLIVADEIFRTKTYQPAIHPGVRTIVDIGSNTGFFSLFCATETGRKDIQGIAIDANPEMAEETDWHLKKNGLPNIVVIHGLAGAPKENQDATFYISQANIASSALAQPNPNLPKKGELKAIQVPAIDIAKEWKKLFPATRIDILKIDVEGFEKDLIENSTELLELADQVAVEIHKWIVSPQEIETLLNQRGFERFAEEGDSQHGVVAFFRRSSATTA